MEREIPPSKGDISLSSILYPIDTPADNQVDPPLLRSQWVSWPGNRLTYSWANKITNFIPGEIMCTTTMYPLDDHSTDQVMALAASTDQNAMYYHHAMKELDRLKFTVAVVSEIIGQMANGSFVIFKSSVLTEKYASDALQQVKYRSGRPDAIYMGLSRS
jgi:hypothetical protein